MRLPFPLLLNLLLIILLNLDLLSIKLRAVSFIQRFLFNSITRHSFKWVKIISEKLSWQ